MKKYLLVFYSVWTLFSSFPSSAQNMRKEALFTEIALKIDTATWYSSKHSTNHQGAPHVYFRARQPQEIAEIRCFSTSKFANIQLLPSDRYTILDTLKEEGGTYWCRIQFTDLTLERQPVLVFRGRTSESSTTQLQELHLMPCFDTHVFFTGEQQDIYQEEEKRLDLKAENLYNIQVENRWFSQKDFDYRVTQVVNGLVLQVKAHSLGYKNLTIGLKSIKPYINSNNQLTQELPPLVISFFCKPNQLEFINVDKASIYISPDFKYSEEIQIDYNKNFNLNKTYRIEDSQEAGGNLVAELFTIAPMGNNKLLCKLRTFSLHKASDGYLFIKEDDKSRFITNFNIIEKPKIEKISLQTEGSDWTTGLHVYPGQQLELRIEGKGLEKSYFQFDGCTNVKLDSARVTDEALFYTMKVPLNIPKKKVAIYMNRKATAYEMQVREYERPRDFDFIRLNYGLSNYIPITDDRFSKPVLYDKLLREINIQFNNSKIDEGNRLYGKQYFSIEIRLLNSRNELTDIQTINNLTVCPGENSPRFAFYDQKDCKLKSIYLNEYLRQKTYNLEPFSQVIITVKHDENKYSIPGYTRKINFILKRDYLFDIQFSFPTGLFVKRFNDSGVGNLTGISTSVLASISFYDPRRIGQLLPYSVGIGFLGINAFSFTDSPDRDAGVVMLATLNPLNRNGRFQIPIYFGGGYLIKANTAFLVFGPGIQFRF
ncbi:MAG: hypothetical protein K2Q22_15320 [Cytophagales bacterium]|nr:hypothetical protein [Cytophagales bacterium]